MHRCEASKASIDLYDNFLHCAVVPGQDHADNVGASANTSHTLDLDAAVFQEIQDPIETLFVEQHLAQSGFTDRRKDTSPTGLLVVFIAWYWLVERNRRFSFKHCPEDFVQHP